MPQSTTVSKKIKIRKKNPTAAYPGSLFQQNFSESDKKGYLLWDIENRESEFRHIINDYGFAKIDIAYGENIWDRIDTLKTQLSANPKKTKIEVIYRDYEENYSGEKDAQIFKYIRDKFGCEQIKVKFEGVAKEIRVDENGNKENEMTTEEFLVDYIKNQSDFDLGENKEEILADIIELHRETNKTLGIDETKNQSKHVVTWDLNKLVVSNLFSFPVSETIIDFDELPNLTAIVGPNGSGKSNILRTIFFAIYGEMLGQSDSKSLINIYTDKNIGYSILNITIDGVLYQIKRDVKKVIKKDGIASNAYNQEFKKVVLEYDEDGNIESERWEKEKSDNATADQNEIERLILNTLGNPEDFLRTSLHIQDHGNSYLSLKQQPKNQLISRFLNLEPYTQRFEVGNEKFKQIRRAQKEMGSLEDKMKILSEKNVLFLEKDRQLSVQKEQKQWYEKKRDKINEDVLSQTKQIGKKEETKYKDKNEAKNILSASEKSKTSYDESLFKLNVWIKDKFESKETFESLDKKIVELTRQLEKIHELNIKDEKDLNDKIDICKKLISESKTIKSDIDKWLNGSKIEVVEQNILTLTKQIEKIEPVEITDLEDLHKKISYADCRINTYRKEIEEIERWLKTNFKKELPFDQNEKESDIDKVLEKDRTEFKQKKIEYEIIEKWINDNPKNALKNVSGFENDVHLLTEEISTLKNKIPSLKGKKCPTCGHEEQKPDPEGEKKCIVEIGIKIKILDQKKKDLKDNETIQKHNTEVDSKLKLRESDRNFLQSKKQVIENSKNKKELHKKYADIISKNTEVDKKTEELSSKRILLNTSEKELVKLKDNKTKLEKNIEAEKNNKILNEQIKEIQDKISKYRSSTSSIDKESQNIILLNENKIKLSENKGIEKRNLEKNRQISEMQNSIDEYRKYKKLLETEENNIKELNSEILKIKKNIETEKNNKTINEKIQELQQDLKQIKMTIFGIDGQIERLVGEIKVIESEEKNIKGDIESIRDMDRKFKKYSIYLQSMHRDGIPSQIIRKKLPIINSICNSILHEMIDSLSIDMQLTLEGDIIERFYHGDIEHGKDFSLPITSASGAQRFICSIAIQSALHHISKVAKFTSKIIDEGFGTLDNENIIAIYSLINYMKTKYKKVIVISHRNEIKDVADSSIEVMKSTEGLPKEIIETIKDAGITKLIF